VEAGSIKEELDNALAPILLIKTLLYIYIYTSIHIVLPLKGFFFYLLGVVPDPM